MKFTRRQFVKGGVSAFTVGFAAPQFLTDLAFAQAAGRNLVVLYLGGGNDSLSTVIPYRDAAYYSRRPTLAVPAGTVLQIGTDPSGIELGLHPRLTGLRSIFDQGRLAIIQRTGYQNSSRSHFQGFDIWGTANPTSTQGTGWLGRYLDTLPTPVDPLVGWNTTRETPRHADGAHRRRAGDHQSRHLQLFEPEQRQRSGARADRLDEDLVASAGRSAPSRVRELDGAGGAGHARSGREGRRLRADGDVSQQRPGPGVSRGRRRDEQADRHQGVLGPDRRLRHAFGPGRESGRLCEPDGHGQRQPAVVLSGPEQPGAPQLDADHCLLGVRPPDQ